MKAGKETADKPRISLNGIQKLFFRTQLILIISLALILGVAGTLINIHFETEKRDQNLQNVAEAIANSPMMTGKSIEEETVIVEYLDTLKDTLDDIDVISVVNKDGVPYDGYNLTNDETAIAITTSAGFNETSLSGENVSIKVLDVVSIEYLLVDILSGQDTADSCT